MVQTPREEPPMNFCDSCETLTTTTQVTLDGQTYTVCADCA